MGYNGRNRRLRSSMFPKSGYKQGYNVIFGKRGLLGAVIKTAYIVEKSNKSLNNYSSYRLDQLRKRNLNNADTITKPETILFLPIIVLSIMFLFCFSYAFFLPRVLRSYKIAFIAYGIILLLLTIAIFIWYLNAKKSRIKKHNRKIAIQSAKTNKRLEQLEANKDIINTLVVNICKNYSFKKVDFLFAEKLASSRHLESYFYFTAPLLTKNQFDEIEFSSDFKKEYYFYKDYVKEWERKYWRLSSAKVKIFKLLKELLNFNFFSKDEKLENKFYFIVDECFKIMLSDEEKEAIIYSFIDVNYDAKHCIPYSYEKLWKVKSVTPDKIDEILMRYDFEGSNYTFQYEFHPTSIAEIERFESRYNNNNNSPINILNNDNLTGKTTTTNTHNSRKIKTSTNAINSSKENKISNVVSMLYAHKIKTYTKNSNNSKENKIANIVSLLLVYKINNSSNNNQDKIIGKNNLATDGFNLSRNEKLGSIIKMLLDYKKQP